MKIQIKVIIIIATLLLFGCGQKGALTLPSDQQAQTQSTDSNQ